MNLRCTFSIAFIALVFLFAATVHGQSRPPSLEKRELNSIKVNRSDQVLATRTITEHDQNGDHVLEGREIQQLRWASEAREYDSNKDGKLTTPEVSLWFANRRTKANVTSADETSAAELMILYDKNGDHELDAMEMTDGRLPQKPTEWDADQDNRLGIFEVAKWFAHHRMQRLENTTPNLDQEYAIVSLSLYDKNQDRQIDALEMNGSNGNELNTLGLDIKSFDTNHDAKLSDSEIAAAFSEKRLSRSNVPAISNDDKKAAARLIIQFDKNRNSKIDIDELSKRQAVGSGENRVTILVFVEFDSDYDKRLSHTEIAQYIACRRNKP